MRYNIGFSQTILIQGKTNMKITEPTHHNLFMTFDEVMELLIRPCRYSPGIDFPDEEWERWHDRHEAERKAPGPFARPERLVMARRLNRIGPALLSDKPALYNQQGYRVKLAMVKEHVCRRKFCDGRDETNS